MAITNPVGARDVVFIQRDNINSAYGEIHVSGTLLIPYIDATGNITVADSGSFFTLFPPSGSVGGGGSGTSIITASLVPITSSWAESASFAVSAVSASWAPAIPSDVSISSSWASASYTSRAAISASWATSSYTSSYVLGNVFGTVTGSSFGTSSQAVSASWAPQPNSVASSSWASASYTASFLTLGTYPITASQAVSASWASQSFSSSYSEKAGTASFALNAGSGTSIVTGSLVPITSSWSNTSSYAIKSDVAVSASWSSASYTASHVSGNVFGTVTGSVFGTASQAVSASWAPSTPSTVVVSSSWASASYTASLINVLFTASNANYYVPFVANTGSQQVYIDSASIYYNPGTDTLTVHYISASSVTASLLGTASWAESASYVDLNAFTTLILPFQYTYKNSTVASDPGNGNFRYNSLTSGSITEIYFDALTDGGLDITNIINSLKSGSYNLYIQDKTDGTKSSLFTVRSTVTDNTGWFTVPVTYLSSGGGGLPNNNKVCAVYVINKNSIVPGETYPVTASWAVSASWAPPTPSDVSISSSWASASYTASFLTPTLQYAAGGITASFSGNHTGSTFGTASQAVSASWAPGSVGGTSIVTGSLVPITASWAQTASFVNNPVTFSLVMDVIMVQVFS